LYFRDNFDNFPLKNVVEKPPCTLAQQSSNAIQDHHTVKENPKIKPNHPIPVHIPVPRKVPDRYKPLILPPVLNPLPIDHPKYLPRFDGENGVTAQRHIQAFEDYLNRFEVDHVDVSIRLFALSLQGEVRTWFKTLPKASISNLEQFLNLFLDRWMIKVNLLLLIDEYNQLKRLPNETVQRFSNRFNQIYHSMSLNIRPPPDLALLHYPRAFDPEIEFRLRERNPSTMKQMQDMAMDVEVNLKMRDKKRKAEQEQKLHSLLKEYEEMMQKVTLKVEGLERRNTSVLQRE